MLWPEQLKLYRFLLSESVRYIPEHSTFESEVKKCQEWGDMIDEDDIYFSLHCFKTSVPYCMIPVETFNAFAKENNWTTLLDSMGGEQNAREVLKCLVDEGLLSFFSHDGLVKDYKTGITYIAFYFTPLPT